MRFAILVVGAVGVGALSVGAVKGMISPNGMFGAARALGGDPARIRVGEINPVKAYQDVMRQIRSGETNTPFPMSASTPLPSIKITGPLFKPYDMTLSPATQRAISSGISARIGQDIRRAQDIAAYGRNPIGWHGRPPH